jgi:hypothetical protein
MDHEGFEGDGGGRRLPAAAVALTLLVAVVAGARLAGDGVRAELTVAETPAPPTAGASPGPVAVPRAVPTAVPAADAVPEVLPGSWRAFAAPVGSWARTRHTATWTGADLLIFGGQPDPGADALLRYQPPSEGGWIVAPPSPLGSRVGHTATWTGEELVVVEGAPVGPQAAVAAQSLDAAAYDPGRDTWRVLPPMPINPRSGHVALWTGEEVLVYGGSRSFEGYAPAALYDPERDRWRLSSPSPLARAHGLAAAVWTGEEALIWTGTGEESVAAYDPRADTWRLLPGSPIGMRSASAVWTGEDLLLLGQPEADRAGAGGLSFDLAAERWAVLPPSPQQFAATVSAVWTGRSAIVVGGPQDAVGAAWTPDLGRWQRLPPGPQPALSGHAAVWTGEDLLVWGGLGDGVLLGTGMAFRPAPP